MSNEIKNMKDKIKKERKDKKKINLLNQLSYNLSYNNPKEALEHSEEAFDLSIKIDYKAGMGYSLKNKGNALNQLGEHKRGLFFLFRSLNIFNEIDDKEGKVAALNGIGISYYRMDNYSEALNYYYASLQYIKELNQRERYISIMNNIAIIYNALGEYNNALECFQKLISDGIPDDNSKLIVYANLGDTNYEMKEYKKALEYYKTCIKLMETNPNKSIEGNVYWKIGLNYFELENDKFAKEYIEKGLEVTKKIGRRYIEGELLLSLGLLYIRKGNFDKSIKFLNESFDIAQEGNYENLIHKLHKAFSKAYGLINDYQKSLEHYEKYHKFAKKLHEEETKAKINNLTLAYEIEKKQIETDIYAQFQKDKGNNNSSKSFLIKQIEKQNDFINKKLLRYRYPSEIIFLTVIWYIDFNLSYRELSAMLEERGIEISHETVHKWVKKFSDNMKELKLHENRYYSLYWKIIQTDVEILGKNYFYYKAVNSYDQLLDFYLSKKENYRQADIFLRGSIATPISKPDTTEEDAIKNETPK